MSKNQTSAFTKPMYPSTVSTFSIEQLNGLMSFLESNTSVAPSVSVLPNFLKSVLSFVNERKRIKIEQEQFLTKLDFVNNMVDKRLRLELDRIDMERDAQIASIRSDVTAKLAQIDKAYQVALRKLEQEYALKQANLQLEFELLERRRREQECLQRELIRQVKAQSTDIRKCTAEIEQVAAHLSQKLMSGTSTKEEQEYYLLLKRLQLESIVSMQSAICQLSAKIN